MSTRAAWQIEQGLGASAAGKSTLIFQALKQLQYREVVSATAAMMASSNAPAWLAQALASFHKKAVPTMPERVEQLAQYLVDMMKEGE